MQKMDTIDEFTIHLPSNTRFMESNTASKYVVKLALPANLSGDWECGLKEIHYPRSWYNVSGELAVMELRIARGFGRPAHLKLAPLQPGNYATNNDLTDGIQTALREVIKGQPATRNELKVYEERYTGRVRFEIPENISIGLHPHLSAMLGYGKPSGPLLTLTRNSRKQPEHPMTVQLVDALYVYSDVVQSSLVGDVMAPLLRVVPVRGEHGEMCHVEYIKPIYYPLAKLNFSTVEIHITDSAGRKIQFISGKTTVVLHFRRKKLRRRAV